jgi:hypothetical protein
MATFVLVHRHAPRECCTAYAAWSGFHSPLRRNTTLTSCVSGEHRIYWVVEATDERSALSQLPDWLAERTDVSKVQEVAIP